MKLQKIWINNQPKEHTFIVFNQNTLYRKKVKKIISIKSKKN